MSQHAARLYRGQPRRRAFRKRWLAQALALVPLLAILALLAGCGPQAGDWRLLSPSGVRIYSLASDPNILTLVYAGADNGMVYRARADQTGLAVPSEGIPANAVVASLLPDPKVPGRVFAGTTAGLYRSNDYGDRWNRFGSGLPPDIAALTLASTPNDNLMLAGMDGRGIYRSADNGATWTPASNGLPAQATVTGLAWDPVDQQWWLGLQNTTSHSLFSSDDGRTWTPSDEGIPARADINALISQQNSGGGSLRFAATSAGLYYENGDRQPWKRASGGLPSGSALAVTAIAGQPGGVVVAIGSGVYTSSDYGVSWTPVAQGLTDLVQAVTLAKDGHGARVYYVAASQLARYPSGATTSNSTNFLLIAAFTLALIVGGYIIMRRSRRFGYAMGARDNERTVGRAAEAAHAWERQSGAPTGEGPSSIPPSASARREAGEHTPSHTLAPTDLTTRERTGAPAAPDKAAQNGHGDPNQRS